MKKILTILMLPLFLTSCVSLQAVEKDKIENVQVIELKTKMNKSKVIEKTKQWIATNFKSAKAVIEYENKEEGAIIGNTILSARCSGILDSSCKYHVSMRIDAKDGKIRIKFLNAYFTSSDGSRATIQNGMYQDYKNTTDDLIFSLVEYIENGTESNDNW